MQDLISVCIPTCRRPALLQEAITSVLSQDYSSIEILVGDDSPDETSIQWLHALQSSTSVVIHYWRNIPPLGQNANVQRLFENASGARLLLLHDDDRLKPGALRALDQAWAPGIHLVYGRQEIIDARGVANIERTIECNHTYFRDLDKVGPQEYPIISGLRQQIPNNGFLITTSIARDISYRPFSQVGVFCDLDFSIRLSLALAPRSIVLIEPYTSQYRISEDAISRNPSSRNFEHPMSGIEMYSYILKLQVPPEAEAARKMLLNRMVLLAMKGYRLRGDFVNAARAYFSPYHPMKSRMTLRGIYHFLYLLHPKIATVLRRDTGV